MAASYFCRAYRAATGRHDGIEEAQSSVATGSVVAAAVLRALRASVRCSVMSCLACLALLCIGVDVGTDQTDASLCVVKIDSPLRVWNSPTVQRNDVMLNGAS